MAGSQQYLTLLDDYTRPSANPPANSDASFQRLEDAWDWFSESQNDHTLHRVAEAAIDCLTVLTFQSREQLLEDARRLHIAKNAGYAGADNPDPWANFRLSTAFGITPLEGVYVRMSDKYIRITNLRRDPSNDRVGEAIEDTLRDLFAYALIAMCLIREEAQAA